MYAQNVQTQGRFGSVGLWMFIFEAAAKQAPTTLIPDHNVWPAGTVGRKNDTLVQDALPLVPAFCKLVCWCFGLPPGWPQIR